MSAVKRERWTEADIDALPPGEHDYFERKSGLLFSDEAALLAKVAKATSAMANSGGGHILLGVEDAGTPDGVPPAHKGRTTTHDWLEQLVPTLVNYPLADFRVHVVQPSPEASRIPSDRQVIVIDVGDSVLAPHQCMRGGHDAVQHVYYYRQVGRSVPAPHFYLELQRQRLVSPTLEASPHSMRLVRADAVLGGIFLVLNVRFLVRNVGRVAAYRWDLRLVSISDEVAERAEDYRLSRSTYPPIGGMDSSIRVDPNESPRLHHIRGSRIRRAGARRAADPESLHGRHRSAAAGGLDSVSARHGDLAGGAPGRRHRSIHPTGHLGLESAFAGAEVTPPVRVLCGSPVRLGPARAEAATPTR